MCLVTLSSSLARTKESYRVGKDVHLCAEYKSNRLAVSMELDKVKFSHTRLDSRHEFLGWVWIFVKTVWDNPAQGVEGCEPGWPKYKIWELVGWIASPPGPNNLN